MDDVEAVRGYQLFEFGERAEGEGLDLREDAELGAANS
jgi:hypothetical protein